MASSLLSLSLVGHVLAADTDLERRGGHGGNPFYEMLNDDHDDLDMF